MFRVAMVTKLLESILRPYAPADAAR